jgi:hypothetical protein
MPFHICSPSQLERIVGSESIPHPKEHLPLDAAIPPCCKKGADGNVLIRWIAAMDEGTQLCNFLNAELPPGSLEPREVAARLQELRGGLLTPLAYKVGGWRDRGRARCVHCLDQAQRPRGGALGARGPHRPGRWCSARFSSPRA